MLERFFDSRFLKHAKAQKRFLLSGLLCTAVASLLDLAGVGIIKFVFAAIDAKDIQLLGWLCLAVIGMYGLKYWFTFGQTYYITKAAQAMTADLRILLFGKLQQLPMAFFNRQRVGALQSVITNDVTIVQNGITSIRDAINGPLLVIGGVCWLFYLSWQLTLLSLLFLPPVIFAIRKTSRKVKIAQTAVQNEMAGMQSLMQESLNAIRIVKSFGAEEREQQRFANQIKKTFDSNMILTRRFASLKPLIELIGAFGLALTIYIGGRLVTDNHMDAASLITFGFTLDRIKNGATSLGNFSSTMSQVTSATERIYHEVLDVESDIQSKPDAIKLGDPKGEIQFHNVSFRYPDGTLAVNNANFTIKPGQVTALVGRSGSGKSTISDLVLRFYDPTEGYITFDGIDIRDLQIDWLRSQIGIVPQQTMLFATTIGENIAYGKPNASREEILAAAYAAHADEFIRSTPDGYETELGEKGNRLSGGEMQRIAIARAIAMEPTLLILDEATSSLDPVSEQAVQSALDGIMKNRTTLLIAHRLNTAARADQIIVLSNGQIIESGSHNELLDKNGTYAGMFNAFSAGVFDGNID